MTAVKSAEGFDEIADADHEDCLLDQTILNGLVIRVKERLIGSAQVAVRLPSPRRSTRPLRMLLQIKEHALRTTRHLRLVRSMQ